MNQGLTRYSIEQFIISSFLHLTFYLLRGFFNVSIPLLASSPTLSFPIDSRWWDGDRRRDFVGVSLDWVSSGCYQWISWIASSKQKSYWLSTSRGTRKAKQSWTGWASPIIVLASSSLNRLPFLGKYYCVWHIV